MKKNNNIVELKKVRKNIDEIDSKIIKLISDRFKEIHKVTKLKDNHDQIIDHERITHILKSVQAKAKKNKIMSFFLKISHFFSIFKVFKKKN